MKKHVATFLAGCAVLVMTLLPLVVDSGRFSWLRWKITIWVTGSIALVSLYFQIKWQMQDEEKEKRRQSRQDDLLRQIAHGLVQRESNKHKGLPSRSLQAASLASALLNNLNHDSEFNLTLHLHEQLQAAFSI